MTTQSVERQFLARENAEELQVTKTEGSFLFDRKHGR
jgi:hypothetical protein